MECGRLNYVIMVLVSCGAQKVPELLVDNITNLDVNWIIVHGKHASEENKLLLAEAAKIFQLLDNMDMNLNLDFDLNEELTQPKVVPKPSSSNPKSTKRAKMHKSIFAEGGIQDGTHVAYMSKGEIALTGRKQGHGILCDCCKNVISPSQFEIHAGRANRKKPYENIFISNGASLHAYACRITEKPLINKKDALCGVNCCERIIVNSKKHDLVACAICRSYAFDEDGFTDQTVIVCDQCELEFHIGCLREHHKANLKALPPGRWFCSVECGILNYVIKVLVTCGAQKVPLSLVDNITNLDVNWIVVHGKYASEESKLLLAEAAEIFHVGFNPIIDLVTGKDFIDAMTYGKTIEASDFSGVLCAILTINSKAVTAGLFRVFGHEIVELPIVATRQPYQGKGYFKLFFTCFEKLLSFLKIKKLVIPAAKEAKAMWINKFGFRKLTPMEKHEYRQKQTSMVAFSGTCLLEKKVPVGAVTFEKEAFFSLSMV